MGQDSVVRQEDNVALADWYRPTLLGLFHLEVLATAHGKEESHRHQFGEDVHGGVTWTGTLAHVPNQRPWDRLLLFGAWVVVLVSSEESL